MKKSVLLLVPCLLVAFSVWAQEGSHSETQKIVLENEYVRVLDIHVPAGVFEPKHSHARGVTIAMSDYDNETKTFPQEKVAHGHTKFGDVKWAEPVTHEARNTSAAEQHVIRIELKKSEAPAATTSVPDPLDALVVCKDTQKLLFENAYVRAIEEHGPAGSLTPKHSHKRGVQVIMSDFDTEAKMWPDEKISRAHAANGEVYWIEPVTHEVRTLGTKEAYAIRIEVK